MTIREAMRTRRLFFDGAMGTMLQEKGLAGGELPELWNIDRPDDIRDVHQQYLEAGCDIIKTNTFGSNALKLDNTPYDVRRIVEAGVTLARQAADACGHEAYVAMDIGPSGKLLEPLGDLSFDRAVELFAEMAVAGEQAGADLLLIETMSDTYEAKAAVLAAKEYTSLPVVLTMIMDEKGKLLTGGDAAAVAVMFEGLGVDAIGLNCGLGPAQMAQPLAQMQQWCSLPLVCNPNAGLPRSVDGRTVFDIDPADFASQVAELARLGTAVVGGCCGTTPAHIREVVRQCRDIPLPHSRLCTHTTAVCSFAGVVEIGRIPTVVGERINPTGKARFKQALRDKDMDYILQEGITQAKEGAHILDVNVGLPDIDEVSTLTQVVRALQSVVDLPLQMDTSNPAAMELALRSYNGKALVNSVSGKEESMREIFPLVKKYGGVVVALALDENGIPETAQGRLAVARKIVDTAASYGIDKRDILVDALTMTVSTGGDAAKVTLEAVKLIKQELGVKTILGVSNISFGLPRRELVNAAFYTMALRSGLDAAIINPHSAAMMDAWRASCALLGVDENCSRYIASYAEQASAAISAPADNLPLTQAIEQGLKDRAFEIAKRLLENTPPLDIIEGEMVPALDKVGQGFETGTLFLPQLLMSAEAAKAAFEAIRQHMSRAGEQPEKKGKIILATVKGDIHDIGKNIVKVLLQNYNYDVIDLGKDVAPETIVDTACRENVTLVGLSALMTTTVPSMEETIRLLRAACPGCRVMVGGAVLTPEYARQIGADFYGADAMASVRYAEELFG